MSAVSADRVLAALDAAFASSEGMAYLGEDITMIEHQLQAGALAAASGAADALVVASLLHDVGHMVGKRVGERNAADALAADTDAHHDASGARWLAQWFGPEVTEPVRLHVAAKRYLVATETDYAERLSTASLHTLRLQGGPMSAEEIAAFEADPHSAAAVALRRFDEAAKDASVAAPPLATYCERIRSVLSGGSRRRSGVSSPR